MNARKQALISGHLLKLLYTINNLSLLFPDIVITHSLKVLRLIPHSPGVIACKCTICTHQGESITRQVLINLFVSKHAE